MVRTPYGSFSIAPRCWLPTSSTASSMITLMMQVSSRHMGSSAASEVYVAAFARLISAVPGATWQAETEVFVENILFLE